LWPNVYLDEFWDDFFEDLPLILGALFSMMKLPPSDESSDEDVLIFGGSGVKPLASPSSVMRPDLGARLIGGGESESFEKRTRLVSSGGERRTGVSSMIRTILVLLDLKRSDNLKPNVSPSRRGRVEDRERTSGDRSITTASNTSESSEE
jgi:hypothetical protein